MSNAKKDVKFSLKVMVNKEKTKVLFAEIDSSFADVLLSFLTLPLGTIVRILKKHYGDEAPAFGCLTSLYNGLENLDSSHFWTDGAKSILLHPRSSVDDECTRLNLDIRDSQPLEYFVCHNECNVTSRFRSVSMYYDNAANCRLCGSNGLKREAPNRATDQTVPSDDGVFAISTASFLVTDGLKIVSNTGLLQIVSLLGTSRAADVDKAELWDVTFGFAEIMDLLKASLISSTPLSEVILNKTGPMKPKGIRWLYELLKLSLEPITDESNSKKMNLKVIVQKSTKKLLYVEAEEDFVELLFSLLIIPLGGVECLLEGNSSIKSIDNMYTSIDRIDNKYFKNSDAKHRLINPKIPHGYKKKINIFPLIEECLPAAYQETYWHSSIKFPKGRGNYLLGPRTYKVSDDLTVTPFYAASIISSLNKLKIPISDVKELQLQIGLNEVLSILKASVNSTSALTWGLVNHIRNNTTEAEL